MYIVTCTVDQAEILTKQSNPGNEQSSLLQGSLPPVPGMLGNLQRRGQARSSRIYKTENKVV